MKPGLPFAALMLVLTAGLPGCANEPVPTDRSAPGLAEQAEQLAERLSEERPTDSAGLVVQLAFGEEADLDLYVTDPLQDTVYFARHESRTGGRIAADVRCDTTGPRIEEVRFDAPPPGRYRVGIDHPRRCDGTRGPAAYAVAVYTDGESHHAQGSVVLERFEVVVLEFDVHERSER